MTSIAIAPQLKIAAAAPAPAAAAPAPAPAAAPAPAPAAAPAPHAEPQDCAFLSGAAKASKTITGVWGGFTLGTLACAGGVVCGVVAFGALTGVSAAGAAGVFAALPVAAKVGTLALGAFGAYAGASLGWQAGKQINEWGGDAGACIARKTGGSEQKGRAIGQVAVGVGAAGLLGNGTGALAGAAIIGGYGAYKHLTAPKQPAPEPAPEPAPPAPAPAPAPPQA